MSFKLTDFFKSPLYKAIFGVTFSGYFLFYQIVERLILFHNIILPQGVAFTISTSTPVPPNDMPFPLWGPFTAITTDFFDWAMTPLSLGISFILSLLVALNITLYIAYFNTIRLGRLNSLGASLGLIATALSCSCELFTGLIAAVGSNIPFLLSITFMNQLSETLVVMSSAILVVSTLVLSYQLSGREVIGRISVLKSPVTGLLLIIMAYAVPINPALSFVRLMIAGGGGAILALTVLRGSRLPGKLLPSIVMSLLVVSLLPYTWNSPLFPLEGALVGMLGELGFRTSPPWARLGVLHLFAWSMIMPGPISLILGAPIPFFNFDPSISIEAWITTWIAGTPLAWAAGVYYLEYVKRNMADAGKGLRLALPDGPEVRTGWVKWVVLGLLAIISQIGFFLYNPGDFVDYNGYDFYFLSVMTLTATSIATAGALSLGYGVYLVIKERLGIRKVERSKMMKWIAFYVTLFALLGGVVHPLVSGYPYPHFLIDTFGIPMFAPSLNVYISGVVGIFLYPLEVLQLVAASLMSGYLTALTLNERRKSLTAVVFGSIAVCPACSLSSYSFALVYTSLAFVGFLNSIQGQLGLSLVSDAVLLSACIYVLKKGKREKLTPRGDLRIIKKNG